MKDPFAIEQPFQGVARNDRILSVVTQAPAIVVRPIYGLGAENADAIASVDGVDCLWVGHFDLSVSLGIPGEFDNPKFLKAIGQTIAATKKHKKALGRLVPTTDLGIALYKQGFDFCCYSGDVWVLRDALTEAVNRLRQGCKR